MTTVMDRTYTFHWDSGSPSCRTRRRFTYEPLAAMQVKPDKLKDVLQMCVLRGIGRRVTKAFDGQLVLLQCISAHGAHPELGEEFVCDAAFLQGKADVRPSA
jgi:hypothetical protein